LRKTERGSGTATSLVGRRQLSLLSQFLFASYTRPSLSLLSSILSLASSSFHSFPHRHLVLSSPSPIATSSPLLQPVLLALRHSLRRTMASPSPVHLLVTCHGLWGNPSHIEYVKEAALRQAAKGDTKLVVLAAKGNGESWSHTWDGLDGAFLSFLRHSFLSSLILPSSDLFPS
jgi:hypothetical protein